MLLIGLALIVLGLVFHVHVVFVIGIVLVVIGAVLLLLSETGHPVGGRRWY